MHRVISEPLPGGGVEQRIYSMEFKTFADELMREAYLSSDLPEDVYTTEPLNGTDLVLYRRVD